MCVSTDCSHCVLARQAAFGAAMADIGSWEDRCLVPLIHTFPNLRGWEIPTTMLEDIGARQHHATGSRCTAQPAASDEAAMAVGGVHTVMMYLSIVDNLLLNEAKLRGSMLSCLTTALYCAKSGMRIWQPADEQCTASDISDSSSDSDSDSSVDEAAASSPSKTIPGFGA